MSVVCRLSSGGGRRTDDGDQASKVFFGFAAQEAKEFHNMSSVTQLRASCLRGPDSTRNSGVGDSSNLKLMSPFRSAVQSYERLISRA